MKIEVSRAVVTAILSGDLDKVGLVPDPVFGISIPVSCPGVAPSVLQPRSTWSDPAAYDKQAQQLAQLFRKNFELYADSCSSEVQAAGPT
jgi:phosphoenolpyruvate carboxykinase (ATP)